MYKKVIIGLLLLGCISTSAAQASDSTPGLAVHASRTSHGRAPSSTGTEEESEDESSTISQGPTERKPEIGRQQLVHIFSEPVIIGIVFAVMVGIVGTILLIAYSIGRLCKKSVPEVQPPFSNDEGVPLSSVETGNPEV